MQVILKIETSGKKIQNFRTFEFTFNVIDLLQKSIYMIILDSIHHFEIVAFNVFFFFFFFLLALLKLEPYKNMAGKVES